MPTSSARGHPDLQTGVITDFSSFPNLVYDKNGKPWHSDSLEYHRYVNIYGLQQGVATMSVQEKLDAAQFDLDRMVFRGKAFANPRLWDRLQRIGAVEWVRTFFK